MAIAAAGTPRGSGAGTKVARAGERLLIVLETLAESPRPLTIPEICAATGLPRATVHRMVLLLTQRQWARPLADGRGYTLGLRGFMLARATLERVSVREVARPILDQLAEQTGQTLLLGAIYDDRLVYLDRRDGRSVLRVASDVGQVRQPTYGILGKVLLAWAPRETVMRYLQEFPLQKLARRSIVEPRAFLEELDRIRQVGSAIAVEETHDGVAGAAAPVFNASGEVVAALALLCPTPLLAGGKLEEYRLAVVGAARSISLALGWPAAQDSNGGTV